MDAITKYVSICQKMYDLCNIYLLLIYAGRFQHTRKTNVSNLLYYILSIQIFSEQSQAYEYKQLMNFPLPLAYSSKDTFTVYSLQSFISTYLVLFKIRIT